MRLCLSFFFYLVILLCAVSWLKATSLPNASSLQWPSPKDKVEWEQLLEHANQRLHDIPKSLANDCFLGFFIDPKKVPLLDAIDFFLSDFDHCFNVKIEENISCSEGLVRWIFQKNEKKTLFPHKKTKQLLAQYREEILAWGKHGHAYLSGMIMPYGLLFLYKKLAWGEMFYRWQMASFRLNITLGAVKSSLISLGNIGINIVIQGIFDIPSIKCFVFQSMEFSLFYIKFILIKQFKIHSFNQIFFDIIFVLLDAPMLYKRLHPMHSPFIQKINKQLIKPRIQKIESIQSLLKGIKKKKKCLEKSCKYPPEMAQIIIDFLVGEWLSKRAFHLHSIPKSFRQSFTSPKRVHAPTIEQHKEKIKKLMKQRALLLFIVLPLWLSYVGMFLDAF